MPEELFEDVQEVRLRVRDEEVLARAVPAHPRLVLWVFQEEAQFADERLQGMVSA